MAYENDKAKLIKFLQECTEIMDKIKQNWNFLFPKLKEEGEIFSAIYEDMANNLIEAQKAIGDVEDKDLKNHGLTGEHLTFKLSIFNRWKQEFFNQLYKKVSLRSIWEILKKLLDAMDALLDSIIDVVSKAVPGISGVKEIKDAISSLVS